MFSPIICDRKTPVEGVSHGHKTQQTAGMGLATGTAPRGPPLSRARRRTIQESKRVEFSSDDSRCRHLLDCHYDSSENGHWCRLRDRDHRWHMADNGGLHSRVNKNRDGNRPIIDETPIAAAAHAPTTAEEPAVVAIRILLMQRR
jgi:hypothetical protein